VVLSKPLHNMHLLLGIRTCDRDRPQLLAKWQARENQNQNQNIQKISIEVRDKGPKILIITCKGTKTETYENKERK
jgi:hypothetical protein